jgi:ribosomal-protein-alanine N-acetyltransferase
MMTSNEVRSQRLDLVAMSLELMEALLSGDRERAQAMAGYRIPQDWPAGMESTLRFRIAIARKQPEALPLLLRAMVLRSDPATVVGRIGFHGPADDSGMLEIGYEVFPDHQRHGYAREAVIGMFGWARQDPAVRRFRATVSPDNAPSRRLVAGLGFVEDGSQWDEEDGEETIFERSAGPLRWRLPPDQERQFGTDWRPRSLG